VSSLELHRDSFQSIGQRSLRRDTCIGGRGRRIGALVGQTPIGRTVVDQAIDVAHHLAQRFPGFRIRLQGCGHFRVQLGGQIV
jgi:hypothetical protein